MSRNVQVDQLAQTINDQMKKLNLGDSPNDINQQNAINGALTSAGLPANKLNGLIAMAKDHLLCT